MTTVAQCHLPTRPIAVGNRQSRGALTRSAALHLATFRSNPLGISTFPSLAGSFGSQLVVGNRQHRQLIATHLGAIHRHAVRRPASQRIPLISRIVLRGLFGWLATNSDLRVFTVRRVASLRASFQSTSTSTLPSAGCLRAACGSQEPPMQYFSATRYAARRSAHRVKSQHLNEYQTQQQPRSRGFWWACPSTPTVSGSLRNASLLSASPGNSSQRIPACQAATAFGRSSVRKD